MPPVRRGTNMFGFVPSIVAAGDCPYYSRICQRPFASPPFRLLTIIIADGLRPWLLTCLYKLILVVRRARRLSHHHSSRLAATVIPSCTCTYLELSASGVLAVHITINAPRVWPWFLCPYLYIYVSPCTGLLMHIIEPTAPLHGGVGFRNESCSQVENLPQLFHPHTYTPFTTHL